MESQFANIWAQRTLALTFGLKNGIKSLLKLYWTPNQINKPDKLYLNGIYCILISMTNQTTEYQ